MKRSGGEKCIVEEELVVRIISPDVINLTLVDLPGIIYVGALLPVSVISLASKLKFGSSECS